MCESYIQSMPIVVAVLDRLCSSNHILVLRGSLCMKRLEDRLEMPVHRKAPSVTELANLLSDIHDVELDVCLA